MSVNPAEIQFLKQHIHHLWVAMMRSRQRVCALEAAAKLAQEGRTPSLPIRFRSQYGEDAALYEMFDGAPSGFFIEAGAFDGVHFSVTYALEAIGWKGLLVEPIAARAEECRRNRPGSRVVHAALGGRTAQGTVKFQIAGSGQGTEGMLSSIAPAAGSTGAPTEVPYTSLGSLLAQHSGEIDVAVIDVEGAEREVLDGLDLRRTRPKVLTIEDNSFGQDAALYAQIESAGYAMAGRLNINRFYIRTDLPDLMRRAKAVFAFE